MARTLEDSMTAWRCVPDALVPFTVPEDYEPAQVTQEYLHGADVAGDCFRAVIASVLCHELEEVPHFARYSNGEGTDPDGLWWFSAAGYLASCGMWLAQHYIATKEAQLPVEEAIGRIPIDTACQPCLLVGKSPRGDFNHVVVVYDGEVRMDPHPSRDGLESAYLWEQFLTFPENVALLAGTS